MRIIIDRKKLVESIYQAKHKLSTDNVDYKNRVVAYLNEKLRDDIGKGDITTEILIDDKELRTAVVLAKESGIISGLEEVIEFYKLHGITFTRHFQDGDSVSTGDKILDLQGTARNLLTHERTALNFLQMMSGIATNTAQYVAAVSQYAVAVAATRKDWAMELIEKKAVTAGGGYTHRLGLDGYVLIKDNHLAALKFAEIQNPVEIAIDKVYASDYQGALEIEVKTKEEALAAAAKFRQYGGLTGRLAPIIMLDNMAPELVREIVPVIRDAALVEASGNITLENIAAYAAAGVDVISTSRLNRGAKALDLSQKIVQ